MLNHVNLYTAKKGKFWCTDFIHLRQIRLYICKKKGNKTDCINYRHTSN